MGIPLEDIRQIVVPAEDSALQEAMAVLEGRICAFTAAVREVVSSLQLQRGTPDHAIDVDLVATAAVESATTPDAGATSPADEASAPPVRKPTASRRLKPRHNQPAGNDLPLEDAISHEAESSALPAGPIPESEPPAPELTPEELQRKQDEALLAALDEATSKAVRVLHRLNPNKPLAELIRQAEKSLAEQPAKTAGKSWFRFGK